MTKSLVVSTEGAIPSPSWAYCTFLSISFTVLLLYQRGQSIHIRLISFTSSCVPTSYRPIRPADTHRLRTLASWLSALNALISNSTAHCCRRGQTRMLHQPVRHSCHHCWLMSLNLTFPTSLGAGWRATEHGRLSGNCKEEKQTPSTECRQFSDQIKWNKTPSQTACSTKVTTVWRLRQNHSFPPMCQHVNVCLWSMNQSLVLNDYSDDVTTLGLNFQISSGSRTSSCLSYSYSFCHKISPHTWDLAKTWI